MSGLLQGKSATTMKMLFLLKELLAMKHCKPFCSLYYEIRLRDPFTDQVSCARGCYVLLNMKWVFCMF